MAGTAGTDLMAEGTATARAAAADRDIDILVIGEINPDIVVADPDPVPVFDEVERVVGRST